MATDLFRTKYRKIVLVLMLGSLIVRGFLAASLELGNDEVYYRLYALYPDWSHFDHPLMVGLVMQLFSFNMLLQSEFFLRLGSIVFGTVNIWLMFLIGTRIKNERTGLLSALLYTSSIYATVITGIFILPDTPQSLFWLLGIYLILKTFSENPNQPDTTKNLLLIGLVLGLGMLSKYTTVFLWLGIFLYMLFFNREWFKVNAIYYAFVVSLIFTLPILIWNLQNDFISFTFHSGRVDLAGYGMNVDFFFRELLGEFMYNNPVNFVLIFFTMLAVLTYSLEIKKVYQKILILASLPLIISFLIFSLFRETLPHWSAPAYTTLIVLAAAYLDQQKKLVKRLSVGIAGAIIVLVLLLGYFQVNHGIFELGRPEEANRLGKNDPSLDMYGYRQVGDAFKLIVERDLSNGTMPEGSILVGDNWFPLANYDYYAAYPAGMDAFGLADLDHLHKYAWINDELGGFQTGMSGYYITDSKYYRPPNELFHKTFETTEPADTIPVYRGGKVVKLGYIWRLKNLNNPPPDPFGEED